jgi:hypothetical protein
LLPLCVAEPLKEIGEPKANEALFAGLLMVTDGGELCETMIVRVAEPVWPLTVHDAVIVCVPRVRLLVLNEAPYPMGDPCKFEVQTS